MSKPALRLIRGGNSREVEGTFDLSRVAEEMERRDAMPICPVCKGLGLRPPDVMSPNGSYIGWSRGGTAICERCGGYGHVAVCLCEEEDES